MDDDEINFLDIVDKAKLNAERQQLMQEQNDMNEFRQRVTTLQEQTIDKVGAFGFEEFINFVSFRLKCFHEFSFVFHLILENQHRKSGFKAENNECFIKIVTEIHFSWCCSKASS